MTSTATTSATISAGAATAPTRRRQARAEATREALLDAALGEFSAHGFEGASTRAIASAAGTHQPQINYHFESKDALWRAAVDRLFERLDDGVRHHLAGLPPAPDARARFANGIRALVRTVAELPELNRIMVQEATVASDRLRWIVDHHTRPRFEQLTGDWSQLRSEGGVPDIDDAVFYYSIVGAASLAYVNAPEASLLGHDTMGPSFIERHADALVLLFLGPEGGEQ